MCSCKNENLEAIYRFSTKELDTYMKKIEDACEGIDYETEANMSDAEEQSENTQ
jgi:hypothetical protein